MAASETKARASARRKVSPSPGEGGGNELVLAAVTAVLKNLLENGLVDWGVMTNIGGDTTISALPPDRIATGEDEKAQINLFLYQISPKGLYSQSRYAPHTDGIEPRRLGSLPSLDLYYLLTAYGAQDFHTEILLGYAMEMFQETGLLLKEHIQKILSTVASTEGGRVVLPALSALASSNFGDRVEEIKICAQVLNPEEMSRIWTSLQARYRPSASYKVSVLLGDLPPATGAESS